MTDREQKPRKIRRRKTTGRVSGTTQGDFASNSMTSILEQKRSQQTDKPQVDASDDASDEASSGVSEAGTDKER